MIGFSLKRTNVLETSLVFVYVVVSSLPGTLCFELIPVLCLAIRCRSSHGVSSNAHTTIGKLIIRPRQFGSGWTSISPTWKPKTITPAVPTVQALATRALNGVLDNVIDVARTLPPHLLLSLIYRVAVLHLAARIVPALRKSSMGWDDGMDNGVASGFWDGRSLGEEPTVRRHIDLANGRIYE